MNAKMLISIWKWSKNQTYQFNKLTKWSTLILGALFLMKPIINSPNTTTFKKSNMSALYKVKILELNEAEASVTMHVKIINTDIMRIYETVGFGLLLLDNSKRKGFPLGEEISREELYDENWCGKYAQGFVKKVEKIKKVKGIFHPIKEGEEETYEQLIESLPGAILKIYCSDKAWFAHLKEGEEWESNAWDIARSYQPCEPILPSSTLPIETVELDSSVGWMPFPNFLLDQASHQQPKVFFFPRFSESSYVIQEVIDLTGKDTATIMSLHGKYVKDMAEDRSGIFVWNELHQQFRLYGFGRNSSSTKRYNYPRDIRKFGLLALKPNFTRQEKWLNYAELFRKGKPVISTLEKNGKKITLELIGIDDLKELELNKAKILKLLCSNYVETYNHVDELDSHFPLSKLLKYVMDQHEEIYYPKDAIFKVADGIILTYSVEEAVENYLYSDEMKYEELIQHFENEYFTRHKIHIELSDEAFGRQLEKVAEQGMGIQVGFMSTPVEKVTKPILWKDYQALIEGKR